MLLTKKNVESLGPAKRESLFQGVRVIVLICPLIFYFLVLFNRVSPTILIDQFCEFFNKAPHEVAVLGSMYFWSYAVMQPLGGIMSDVLGPRVVVSLSCVFSAVGSMLMIVSRNFGLACFGRLITGIGLGALYVPSAKLFSSWFSLKSFSNAISLMSCIGGIGSVIAATPLLSWAEKMPLQWRGVYIVLICATVGFGALYFGIVRNRAVDYGFEDPEVRKNRVNASKKGKHGKKNKKGKNSKKGEGETQSEVNEKAAGDVEGNVVVEAEIKNLPDSDSSSSSAQSTKTSSSDKSKSVEVEEDKHSEVKEDRSTNDQIAQEQEVAVNADGQQTEANKKVSLSKRFRTGFITMGKAMPVTFKSPTFWLALLVILLSSGFYMPLSSQWSNKLLVDTQGMSAADASVCTLMLSLGLAIGPLPLSLLSNVIGRRMTILLEAIIGVIVAVLLPYAIRIHASKGSFSAIYFFICLSMSAVVPIAISVVKESLPSAVVGCSMGFANFLPFLLSGILQIVFGDILKAHGFITNPGGSVKYNDEGYYVICYIIIASSIAYFITAVLIPESSRTHIARPFIQRMYQKGGFSRFFFLGLFGEKQLQFATH